MRKKAAALMAAVLLAGGLAACDFMSDRVDEGSSAAEESQVPEVEEGSPEDVTLRFLNSVKELDQEAAKELVSDPSRFSLPDMEALSEREEKVVELGRDYLSRMSMKMGDSTEDGDKATVEMTFKVPDLSVVVSDMMVEAVKQATAAALAGKGFDMEEFAFGYAETKVDLSQLNLVEKTAPVTLIKRDGDWLIDTSSDVNMPVADALTGGLLQQMEGLPFVQSGAEDAMDPDTREGAADVNARDDSFAGRDS